MVNSNEPGVYANGNIPYFKSTDGSSYKIAAMDNTNGIMPHLKPKIASANLRHSHDAETTTASAAAVKLKTITFANGISGTLRFGYDQRSSNGVQLAYCSIYKNGSMIGGGFATSSNVYVSRSEDIACGVLAPGDTIELWGYADNPTTCYVRNFRISYDNAADTVLVAGVTNS